MNEYECQNTSWVNMLRQTAEIYHADESTENYARFRMLLMDGICRDEALPLPGEDEPCYYASFDGTGNWLYSDLAPVEDIQDWHGVPLSQCIRVIFKHELDGLLIQNGFDAIEIPTEDLFTMYEAVFGESWFDENETDDSEEDEVFYADDLDEPDDEENYMEKSFDDVAEELKGSEAMVSDIIVKRPLPPELFEPIQAGLAKALLPGGGRVKVRFSNHFGENNMEELIAVPETDSFHLMVIYNMDEYNRKYPLVLGFDHIDPQKMNEVFSTLCCTDQKIDDIPDLPDYRDETGEVYGELMEADKSRTEDDNSESANCGTETDASSREEMDHFLKEKYGYTFDEVLAFPYKKYSDLVNDMLYDESFTEDEENNYVSDVLTELSKEWNQRKK